MKLIQELLTLVEEAGHSLKSALIRMVKPDVDKIAKARGGSALVLTRDELMAELDTELGADAHHFMNWLTGNYGISQSTNLYVKCPKAQMDAMNSDLASWWKTKSKELEGDDILKLKIELAEIPGGYLFTSTM